MAGKAAVSQPAEDVPTQEPSRQGDQQFGLRAQGLGVRRAGRGGTMSQFAEQLHRALQREDAMRPVVTNVQPVAANRTAVLFNFENMAVENRVGWPAETHRSPPWQEFLGGLSYNLDAAVALASYRSIDEKGRGQTSCQLKVAAFGRFFEGPEGHF